jgi:thiamine-phosphate pyrophosphorylase
MEKAAYRIIDANFNRAREALRTIEEFCRFSLDSHIYSAKAKELRHRLCEAVKHFDSVLLINSRDSTADVGKDTKVCSQQKRSSLQDCFTAAAKRLTEALRALYEVSQTIDSQAGAEFETLRFECYTLEKHIVTIAIPRHRFASVKLYVLLNADSGTQITELINLADQCIKGGTDCIQLRAKGIDDAGYLSIAKEISDLCKSKDALFIVNDRIDIAALSGADGVHLGQGDLQPAAARSLSRKPLIVGSSTHNIDELKGSIEAEPDYIAIGSVFDSPTKKLKPAGLQYVIKALDFLKNTGITHVAIGGINIDNIGQLAEKGVRAIAVSSAVTKAPNPRKACTIIKKMIM